MFWVSGFGFRILGFGFRVSGFGFRASGFGIQVSGLGFRVSGLRSRVSGSGIQFEGFGFRVSSFGFQDREGGGEEKAALVSHRVAREAHQKPVSSRDLGGSGHGYNSSLEPAGGTASLVKLIRNLSGYGAHQKPVSVLVGLATDAIVYLSRRGEARRS